jgi:hypothetical protein
MSVNEKLEKFVSKLEGNVAGRDCQILCASFDEEDRLHADARMLHPESSSISPEGRAKIKKFLTKFSHRIEYVEEYDRTAVEDLCAEINATYYRENVDSLIHYVEGYVKSEYRWHLKSNEDVTVIVDLQPGDIISPDAMLDLKVDCDLLVVF